MNKFIDLTTFNVTIEPLGAYKLLTLAVNPDKGSDKESLARAVTGLENVGAISDCSELIPYQSGKDTRAVLRTTDKDFDKGLHMLAHFELYGALEAVQDRPNRNARKVRNRNVTPYWKEVEARVANVKKDFVFKDESKVEDSCVEISTDFIDKILG